MSLKKRRGLCKGLRGKKSTDRALDRQNKFEDELDVETCFDAVDKCDSSISFKKN